MYLKSRTRRLLIQSRLILSRGRAVVAVETYGANSPLRVITKLTLYTATILLTTLPSYALVFILLSLSLSFLVAYSLWLAAIRKYLRNG